jgi:hypothetical protein
MESGRDQTALSKLARCRRSRREQGETFGDVILWLKDRCNFAAVMREALERDGAGPG